MMVVLDPMIISSCSTSPVVLGKMSEPGFNSCTSLLPRTSEIPHSWAELKEIFVGNFLGTYVCPKNAFDIKSCKKENDKLRNYLFRFPENRNSLTNVADADGIGVFLLGTTSKSLIHKLDCKKSCTTLSFWIAPLTMPLARRRLEQSSLKFGSRERPNTNTRTRCPLYIRARSIATPTTLRSIMQPTARPCGYSKAIPTS